MYWKNRVSEREEHGLERLRNLNRAASANSVPEPGIWVSEVLQVLEESLSHPLKLWGAPEKRATVKALVLSHPTSTVSSTTMGSADPQL